MTLTALRVALDLGMVGRNRTGTGTYARALNNELARLPDLELRLLRGWSTVPRRAGLAGRLGCGLGTAWRASCAENRRRRSPALADLSRPAPGTVSIDCYRA